MKKMLRIKQNKIQTVKGLVIMSALILLSLSYLHAQTEPMYSQYMYNMLGVNPAYAGSREATGLNFFQRRQWVGLEGAPKTTSISVDGSAYDKKAGWGVQMYSDKLGVESANGALLSAATRVRVSEEGILSGGISFGLMNYKVDLMSLASKAYQNNDPRYFNNMNKMLPTVGLGLYYNTDKFYAGISMPSILRSRLTALDVVTSGIQKVNKRHIFITSGYVFDINNEVKVKPSTMIKMVSGAPIELDLNANVWLREMLGLGISYRTGDAILGMAELQINENLRFGYAYDMTISPLKYYNNGSHELMLRYEFGNTKTKVKSTRYF